MAKLLKTVGTLPFLVAVFLNAFVDLGHKIVIQNTLFKVFDNDIQVVFTAILNGLILLPFILLFSPAGFMSDRYPKTKIMRISALAAVVLTVGITVCYAMGWFWAAFAMTFLLAAQSAFYSPAKFGYLKAFFGKERLAEANGLVQSVSIVAILTGTFVFSILFEMFIPREPLNPSVILATLVPLGLLLIFTSVVEAVMIFRLPQVEQGDSSQRFNTAAFVTGRLYKADMAPIWRRKAIRLSALGLAMFWSIGQVMLAAFPAFAKAELGVTNTVLIQGIVGASGIGIALGSWLASRLSRNYIETGLIPVGAAGIAVGLIFLPWLTSSTLLIADFLFIGVMGGLFVVPLNALIQFYAGDHEMGRVLAGKNLVQNIAMLGILGVTVGFAILGISSKNLLIVTGVFATCGGLYTVYTLPQSLVRFLLSRIVSLRYRLHVQGMKNIPESGGVLLLGNHISWIDWAIVQLACPRPVRFVMVKSIYDRWYLTWFFKMFGCVPISQGAGSRGSLDTVTALLNEGQVVCLFPEGAISRTGHLGQFRAGFERSANNTENPVKILPFYLRGLWGSQFSRASSVVKRNRNETIKRDIIVAFGTAMKKTASADTVKRRVFDLSIQSWNQYTDDLPTIANAWIDTVKRSAKLPFAIADTTTGKEITGSRALAASMCLARSMGLASQDENVGVLMPTTAGGVLTNMAVLLQGKTVVNLNYSASSESVTAAINQAKIKTVFTSRKFEKKLKGKKIDFSESLSQCKVVYLEDLFEALSKVELLVQWLAVKVFPAFALKWLFTKPVEAKSTAVILFSSGSEGAPKGVQLSHQNIMANLKQVAEVLNAEQQDVFMASLPLFHAFGLTITQFLPLIEGIPMVCHPDPTDAFGVAKAVANYKASILFGTSTFFRLYVANKKVHPLMLESVRLVVAGAEKLNPEVRTAFEAKFHKPVFEGYGATETTPVASVNLPDRLDPSNWKPQLSSKIGTVGMPLPGTSFRIVDPTSFTELPMGEAGMILIGGAQVMQGYLNNQEKTDDVIKTIDGTRWYVTGDKGMIDEDGFLTIVDRYSRFAKVGGEMISLTAVEEAVKDALKAKIGAQEMNTEENTEILAVAITDEKKGEKIVLLCNQPLELTALKSALSERSVNPLMQPSNVMLVEEIPKLGSGKVDYSAAKKIVLACSQ